MSGVFFLRHTVVLKNQIIFVLVRVHRNITSWEDTNSHPNRPYPAIFVEDFNSYHREWVAIWQHQQGRWYSPRLGFTQWCLFCSWPELETHPPISLLGTWFLQSGLCWVSSGANPLPAGCEAANATEASCLMASQYWSQCSTRKKKWWNFSKADWDEFTTFIENSIPVIPCYVWSQLKKLTVVPQSRGCPPTISTAVCAMYGHQSSAVPEEIEGMWKIRTSWQIQDSMPWA